MMRHRVRAGLARFGGDFFQTVNPSRAEQQFCPFAGKRPGGGGTKAARSAGDQNPFILQTGFHFGKNYRIVRRKASLVVVMSLITSVRLKCDCLAGRASSQAGSSAASPHRALRLKIIAR